MKIFVRATILSLFLCCFANGVLAQAKQNPFEIACKIAERASFDGDEEIKGDCFQGSRTALKYSKKFDATPDAAQKVLRKLKKRLGEPKADRGRSYVWELSNLDKGQSHADIVTIILKYETDRKFELMMDRARSGQTFAKGEKPRKRKARPTARALKLEAPTNDSF